MREESYRKRQAGGERITHRVTLEGGVFQRETGWREKYYRERDMLEGGVF